jgi:hypothetical protein
MWNRSSIQSCGVLRITDIWDMSCFKEMSKQSQVDVREQPEVGELKRQVLSKDLQPAPTRYHTVIEGSFPQSTFSAM